MKVRLKDFCVFFAVQLFQYFIVTLNFRAVAQARYGWTFATDLLCAANGYFLIKRIGDSKSTTGFIGYVLGGAVGSLLGIAVTKFFYHQ